MKLSKGMIKVHMYNVENVLRPRGHMKKESISEYIIERLMSSFESWTNKEYGDNINPDELLQLLKKNLKEEIDGAWDEFINRTN